MTEQIDMDKVREEIAEKLCQQHGFHWRNLNEAARNRFRKDADQFLSQVIEPLIEQAKKQKEDEFALRFNPDYLDFQKGVEATKKIYEVKIEQAKQEVAIWVDETFADNITKAQMMTTNTWQEYFKNEH